MRAAPSVQRAVVQGSVVVLVVLVVGTRVVVVIGGGGVVVVGGDEVVVVVLVRPLHLPALRAAKMAWISPAVRARLKISISSSTPAKVAVDVLAVGAETSRRAPSDRFFVNAKTGPYVIGTPGVPST